MGPETSSLNALERVVSGFQVMACMGCIHLALFHTIRTNLGAFAPSILLGSCYESTGGQFSRLPLTHVAAITNKFFYATKSHF